MSQARDQVTLDLHAWRYPGTRAVPEGLRAPSLVNPARPITRTKIAAASRPLDPPSTSPCAVHLPQDRREGRLLEVPEAAGHL